MQSKLRSYFLYKTISRPWPAGWAPARQYFRGERWSYPGWVRYVVLSLIMTGGSSLYPAKATDRHHHHCPAVHCHSWASYNPANSTNYISDWLLTAASCYQPCQLSEHNRSSDIIIGSYIKKAIIFLIKYEVVGRERDRGLEYNIIRYPVFISEQFPPSVVRLQARCVRWNERKVAEQ